jgi:hypothetical protein
VVGFKFSSRRFASEEDRVFDSNRLLNTILDHMLQLLPAEPAHFKRLDDIGEAEPRAAAEPLITESSYPDSGVHATTPLRAAS